MKSQFVRIGLFAKHSHTQDKSVSDTFLKLIKFLDKRGHDIVIESKSTIFLSKHRFFTVHEQELGKHCDLVIVIGGDGSFLQAARAVAADQIPVLGINRGKLGFLADILPNKMEQELGNILEGHYQEEKRFLLHTTIIRKEDPSLEGIALNDVVLYSGSVSRMIEFEVYINDALVLRQKADGIITATPTGSTAYALSAGGPILYPTLNAMTLTPLSPHTLSSRPLVIDSQSEIKFIFTYPNNPDTKLSCDGQLHFDLNSSDEIIIKKYPLELTLIHPKQHQYFKVLREKLGWNT